MSTKHDDSVIVFPLYILVGALVLLLSTYAGAIDPALSFFAIWMIVIAVATGGFVFLIARVSIFFGAGLITLSYAFNDTIRQWFGMRYYRVYNMVEANPNYHVNEVNHLLLYGILPLTTGLALCILGYMRKRRIPTGGFGRLFLLILGGFLTFWGFISFQASYALARRAYFEESIRRISNSLQLIYITHSLIGTLWLVTGIFLLAIPAYALYKDWKIDIKDIATVGG